MTQPHRIIWEPTDRQAVFLAAEEEEVLYGGAAGGGKTDAMIVDALGLWQQAPLNPRYKALILRRSYQQLREVIDRTRLLYPAIGGLETARYHEAAHEWRFASGAKVIMGYAEREQDVLQYQGEEFQWIGLEELTQWPTPYVWNYLRSRLRGTSLSKLMRANCNPGGVGSQWVQDHWRIPDDGTESCYTETFDVDGQQVDIRRRFIPAKLTDNPYLPPEYRANLMAMSEMDRRALLEGRWDVREVPGAIYKREIDAARLDGRICSVPYDPSVPVHTAWDLGIGDSTALWLTQIVGREIHLIDYYEASGEALSHYCGWLDERGYRYGDDLLPHDAMARELGTGKTREEILRKNGRRVRIIPRAAVEDGINAVRLMLPRTWTDATRCRPGLKCLESYRREWNDKMGEFKATPVHDWSSHGADALRTLAMGLREIGAVKAPGVVKKPVFAGTSTGWMG